MGAAPEPPADRAEILVNLANQYMQSVIRFSTFANIASKEFVSRVEKVVNAGRDSNPTEFDEEIGRFQAFHGPFQEVNVVFMMSLLDSFINGLSGFLMHAYPERFLGDSKFEVRQLVSQSRADVLNQAVMNKLRAFSRDSILHRISDIEAKFGISFEIDQDQRNLMRDTVRVRNDIIHESYALGIQLTDDMALTSTSYKTSVEVPDEVFNKVIQLSEIFVAKLLDGVIRKIENRKPSKTEQVTIDALIASYKYRIQSPLDG